MKVMEWIEALDQFVIDGIGAGVVAIVALLLFIALLVCVWYIKSEEVIVDDFGDIEVWHYKGKTVVVDKKEVLSDEN